jgi:protocatechuate 3,4-dioxygenase beta subunit
MATDHHSDALEDHDLGLSHDLPRIVEKQRRWGRRGLMGLMGGVGAAALVGCGSDDVFLTGSGSSSGSSDTASASPSTESGTTAASDVDVSAGEIPEETPGPYPGDGSNGVNVLDQSGIVRSDLTTSFGSASGVAEGVPVTVDLTVYDLNGTTIKTLAGGAVYLWHCDREGRYSLYDEEIADENYLRGVQETADDGSVRFTTVFPACYDGRWPHMHFEVYQSLDSATSHQNKLRTSQLAIPEASCREVYGVADGYDASVANLDSVSLDRDMVFSDGYSLELATVTGSADAGYTFSLNVPV